VTALYYYTGRSAEGRFVRGSIEAGTETAALATLRTRALFVTSIERSSGVKGTIAGTLQMGPVSQTSLVLFFRSFATLTHAGVTIRRALDVAAEQCRDARLREALYCIVNDVESGLALSAAMARHPREFSRLFVAMIRAGEVGGVLDEVLERLAVLLERDRTLRKRVVSSLTYPAVVCCASIALVVFLLVSIVPMFQTMYDQMHVPLPAITAALIRAGSTLRSPAAWIAGAMAACAPVVALVRLQRNEAVAPALERIVFCLPIIGAISRKTTHARLARMLGTLLRSGVGLVAALDVVRDVVSGGAHCRSLLELQQCLSEGSSVSEPLARTGLYEPMFLQMLRVGEETGALDSMLLRIADYYDVDVETALTSLGSLLEPALILVLGGAVGFIVSAIFIPLYTLIGNMK
jgi:type IV pilus assembly protein PilC